MVGSGKNREARTASQQLSFADAYDQIVDEAGEEEITYVTNNTLNDLPPARRKTLSRGNSVSDWDAADNEGGGDAEEYRQEAARERALRQTAEAEVAAAAERGRAGIGD